MWLIIILLTAILITLLEAWSIAGWIFAGLAVLIAICILYLAIAKILDFFGELFIEILEVFIGLAAWIFNIIYPEKIAKASFDLLRRFRCAVSFAWQRTYFGRILQVREINKKIDKRKSLGYDTDELEEQLSKLIQNPNSKNS